MGSGRSIQASTIPCVAPAVEQEAVVAEEEVPAPGKMAVPPPAGKAPARRNYWWLIGLTAVLALVCVASCAALAIPLAGINSPKVCAVQETKIYDQPISSAHTSGAIGVKGCVLVDAKTTGGWGRIAGLTVYRGKWVYLGVFRYDLKEISELPIVKR